MTTPVSPFRVRGRRLLLSLCLLPLFMLTAFGAEEARRTFNIPADAADKALKVFSEQAGRGALISSETASGVKTRAVKGSYTPSEALDKMLEDTGLTAVQDEKSGAFVVKRETPAESKNAVSRPASSRAADPVDNGVIKLDTFEVMGSKLLNMDKPRTRDDAQPYVVFDREKIEQSGISNLEYFFKQRLTMNAVSRMSSENASISNQNTAINLRGLGTTQTLVLIDGRRAPDVSFQGNFSQFDVGAIPMGAIERIEILPTTASAIYGGGATGGAINIIMRRDYVGAEVRLLYDNSFQSDSAIRRAELNAGFNFEGGKTNLLLSTSVSNAKDMEVQDRDFTSRQRALLIANRGYIGYNTASGLALLGAAYTTNIKSAAGTNLTLKDGTPLNSPITFVPTGYAGPGSDGGAAFVTNAGKLNLAISKDASTFGGEAPLFPKQSASAFSAALRRQFTPALQAFLEGSYSERQTKTNLPVVQLQTFATTALSASAPGNPFQQSIVFFGSAPGEPLYLQQTRTVTARVAGGVIVRLPHEWMAEADYTAGKSQFFFKTTGSVYNSAALTADVQSGAVNFFRDTNIYPVNLTAYVDPSKPVSGNTQPYATDLADATLRMAGPAIRLPAGLLQATMLAEHRKQSFDDLSTQLNATTVRLYPARDQSIDSAYAEFKVPLISESAKIPGVQNLDLQLSVRKDEYTTHAPTGSVDNPTSATVILHETNKVHSTDPLVAMGFQPVRDLKFRVSYGTGFLAPAVNQLVPTVNNNTVTTSFTDSRRGNTTTTLVSTPTNQMELDGGNPNLKPERSKSWSAGMILTPRFLSGLRLSIDYTRMDKTDNIAPAPFSSADIATFEQTYPNRVVRGPNLPGDLPGWAGPVTFLDLTLVNLATVKVAAYDLQLDYDWRTETLGTFQFFAVATRQDHLIQQATPQAAPVENAGTPNPLRYRMTGGALWKRGRWTVGWNFQYYDSFWLNTAHTFDPNQGSAKIPSQIYHDIYVTLAPGRNSTRSGWRSVLLNNTEMTLGVHDIFNPAPPVRATTTANVSYSDPRRVSYWLSFKRSFN